MMNSLPEDEAGEPRGPAGNPEQDSPSSRPVLWAQERLGEPDPASPRNRERLSWPCEPKPPESICGEPEEEEADLESEVMNAPAAAPDFESCFVSPVRPPERTPNFGHLGLLSLLLAFSLLCTGLITQFALHRHLFGVSSTQQALTDIHYTLGSEGLLYLLTFAACLIVFPLVWHKSFFAGVQWNFAAARRLRWRLLNAALACFLLAILNSLLVPGPSNAPIDKIFRTPGAAWLLFGFGVTFAPFFEETFFRGFLLPSFCTAFDWIAERATQRPRLPLLESGHPQWSMSAMVAASFATSLPFAWMHAAQTGYSVGPFALLVGVSLVLCAIRLTTRSLASSVLVHASYNFMLFAMMLVGTGGFRHLEKM
jgi:membrane protease YdiL (CAAX protease family)